MSSFDGMNQNTVLTSCGVHDALDAHDRVLAVCAGQRRRHRRRAQPRRVRRPPSFWLLARRQRRRTTHGHGGGTGDGHHHSGVEKSLSLFSPENHWLPSEIIISTLPEKRNAQVVTRGLCKYIIYNNEEIVQSIEESMMLSTGESIEVRLWQVVARQ